jgi:hypothetical protein
MDGPAWCRPLGAMHASGTVPISDPASALIRLFMIEGVVEA